MPVAGLLVKGELLNIGFAETAGGPPAGGAEVVVVEEAFKTDAKGLPANCRRSSEALSEAAPEAAGAAGAAAGAPPAGAETPKRSKMLGVPESEAALASGAAKGLVAFCCSCKYESP